MKTKLLNVVNKCTTLKQLLSASNYIVLYANAYGTNGIYYDGMTALRNKLEQISGASVRNMLDYKAYAEHLLQLGNVEEANSFIEFAEMELHNLEDFAKEVQNA